MITRNCGVIFLVLRMIHTSFRFGHAHLCSCVALRSGCLGPGGLSYKTLHRSQRALTQAFMGVLLVFPTVSRFLCYCKGFGRLAKPRVTICDESRPMPGRCLALPCLPMDALFSRDRLNTSFKTMCLLFLLTTQSFRDTFSVSS